MQEVLFVKWCDACQRVDERKVEATFSSVISVSDVKREIDLCAEHRDKIVGDLPDLLLQFGRMPDIQVAGGIVPATQDTKTCPLPDCGWRTEGKNSLSSHSRSAHGVPLGELRRQVAQLTGIGVKAQRTREKGSVPARNEPIACDVCGVMQGSPQGLGAHKKFAHGIEGTSKHALKNREQQEALVQ